MSRDTNKYAPRPATAPCKGGRDLPRHSWASDERRREDDRSIGERSGPDRRQGSPQGGPGRDHSRGDQRRQSREARRPADTGGSPLSVRDSQEPERKGPDRRRRGGERGGREGAPG